MIVAVSIFIITTLIVVGGLVSLSDAARKARATRTVTDNLGAAIESISRNMRIGSTFHCGCGTSGTPSTPGDSTFPTGSRNCPMTGNSGGGGDVCIAYEPPGGDPSSALDQVVYRLSSGRIQRSKDGGTTYLDITAPELNVSTFRFYVGGTTVNDHQPFMTMIIRAVAGERVESRTEFNIQTTISSRSPNFDLTP